MRRYLQAVRTAAAQRRLAPKPAAAPIICVTVVLIVFYITASVFLVPPSEEAAFNFVDERGAVTALSAIFLAAGAGFALATFLLGRWPERQYRLFWLAMTCTVGFLALDELLSFHERAGDILYEVSPLGNAVDHSPLRNLNDAIVILYGLIAIPLGLLFLPAVLSIPRVLTLLLIASGFYIIHTAIDSVSEPATYTSIVCEESAKLYSSGFIALAMLTGLLATVAELREETPPSAVDENNGH